jgi:carbamoyltransferase
MKILGLNKGVTATGKQLRHGGAAIYADGRVIALSEERISGVKYRGGYEAALRELLHSEDLQLADFDEICISTCCEQEGLAKAAHPLAGDPRLRTVNHHLSHASLAFYASGFREAIVAVIDGGGNVLSADEEPAEQWWEFPREQHSYFIGSRVWGLKLIDRDLSGPFDVGLGELYRAFTYWLGWHSSTNASKAMALAGHGRRHSIGKNLYEFTDGQLQLPVRNDPTNPLKVVAQLADALGVDFGEPRQPGGAVLQVHKDVAAFLQRGVEEALMWKLRHLQKEHQVDRLCIAGGLGLNVVANARLLELFSGGVYVPSAPGDEGQCLGNVYAALAGRKGTKINPPVLTRSQDAFLGPPRQINSKAIAESLGRHNLGNYVVFETTDSSELVAQMLSDGLIICMYRTRSEFGPRALGSRSILADPRRPDVLFRLNSLKGRDWFMPFAPVILKDQAAKWFEQGVESPFMSFAVQALPRTAAQLPAVINADGTARIQTVDGNDKENELAAVLRQFNRMTSVPVLLNTSFNLGGRPIVETVDQAIAAFGAMPLNVLAIGRFVILKSLSPDLLDLPVAGSLSNMTLEVHHGGQARRIRRYQSNAWRTVRDLQALTRAVVFVRTELPLFGDYLRRLREGRKQTTIRFRKGAVEIPYSAELPLFETSDFGPGDRSHPTEHVSIKAIRYWRFGELDDADAVRDGFESVEHMRKALKTQIYPGLTDDDWVTVYDISLVK